MLQQCLNEETTVCNTTEFAMEFGLDSLLTMNYRIAPLQKTSY